MTTAAASTPPARDCIKVMSFPGLQNLPIFAAQAKGFFDARGLAVELLPAPSSDILRGGLINNDHQIVHGAVDILPHLGRFKVHEIIRAHISELMTGLADRPANANRTLACLRKMFNLAELWGYRPDGSNPCRHIQKFAENGSTRFITDDEMRKLFTYLDRSDREGLEHPFITLAIRLQFELVARKSEVLVLEWAWIDLERRRVTWPDSKTGGMTKPLSDEAHQLLSKAPRFENSPFVCPSIFDLSKPMTDNTYQHGWRRILTRAGVPHVGTHGIHHRAATDIANAGVPLKVGMALTAHKTVFMRYIHNEDEPVRMAADAVAARRRIVVAGKAEVAEDASAEMEMEVEAAGTLEAVSSASPPPGLKDGKYALCTKVGNYRPFRHRRGDNRAVPPGIRHDKDREAIR